MYSTLGLTLATGSPSMSHITYTIFAHVVGSFAALIHPMLTNSSLGPCCPFFSSATGMLATSLCSLALVVICCPQTASVPCTCANSVCHGSRLPGMSPPLPQYRLVQFSPRTTCDAFALSVRVSSPQLVSRCCLAALGILASVVCGGIIG